MGGNGGKSGEPKRGKMGAMGGEGKGKVVESAGTFPSDCSEGLIRVPGCCPAMAKGG